MGQDSHFPSQNPKIPSHPEIPGIILSQRSAYSIVYSLGAMICSFFIVVLSLSALRLRFPR
ncbi:uncharacterized protein BDW43DRAFT_317555 [Aspergillus alliaceus]|uniref:uncharacterized protein n=1 Tax=Petromyces alliaceus TaxID=209559 RepID=UPI0012A6D7D6|nr:uncharacterized protein BDW43DRAFT_317555 [Aspergillus alliaceus]KAB8226788.1 hypothetical protein BDW43DRAFT_317555 [Aspergillus alliaceus]